jgi:hypothetical protein
MLAEVLAQQCDVLIAIWDGAGPEGEGGTAEVVSKARELASP